MIQTKNFIVLFTVTTLLLTGAAPVLAFKGIGSSQPGTERESMANMAISQHQGNQDTVVAKINGVDIQMGPLMKKVMDVIGEKYGGTEVTAEIAQSIRKDAFERLAVKLDALNFVPKKRRPTRTPIAEKERRLKEKHLTKKKKETRRVPDEE